MALTKITGKDFKEAVDWLLKEKQGCVHQVLGRTDEGTELCLVIGWADIGYDLEEVKKNGYEDEGYYICSKIGYQHRNNGMQSDFEWDFPMPYNPETGDVWDTDTYVAKGDEQSWQTDADMYNKEAEKIWATWGVPNEDGQTTLDIMESKKKEAKKNEGFMEDLPYDAPVAIDALCAEIMSHTEAFTIEDAAVAEMCGKWYIRNYADGPTAAHNEEEWVDEVLTGLSGSPVDGSPFGAAEAEEYAHQVFQEELAEE